jgi:hypothetical protein
MIRTRRGEVADGELTPEDLRAAQPWPPQAQRWRFLLGIPPAMVLLDQWVSYALVSPLCLRRAPEWLALPTFLSFLACAVCGLLAWRRERSPDLGAPGQFLRWWTVLQCGLFAFAALALAYPRLLLDPCDL